MHVFQRLRTVRTIWSTKRFILLFAFFAIHGVYAQADSVSSKVFSVSELQSDLAFWRNRLETKHPLIYLYRTKAEVDHFFDSLNATITRPMSELEFFRHIAPVSSFLCDGHNSIIPSKSTIENMRTTHQLLPLELEYFEGGLYVVRNLSDQPDILLADEVYKINGIEASEMFDQLRLMVPHEGTNWQLAQGTINEHFRFYFHLFYGFEENYQLTMRYSDGSEKEFVVAGRTLDEIRTARSERYPADLRDEPRGIFLKETLDPSIAVLEISTFDSELLRACKQHFRREIRGIFKQLKKSSTEKLILDVRNNNGGNPDFVKVVLKHLFDHRFEQSREFRIVKNPTEEAFYPRTKKKWYPWFGIGKFSPSRNHFDGELIVLQNENTFSAGVELLSVLQKYNRATFMGTESGGNPIIMGGYIVKTEWELPHTKLQFSSATHCSILDDLDKNTGRGVIPNIEIERDLFDTLTGYDACLEFAIEFFLKTQ